jgi:long-chain acyl-CoA synthetase
VAEGVSSGLVPGAGSRARPRTVAALWLSAQGEPRDRPAYLVEQADARSWQPMSWPEAGKRVAELANGLLALGLAKGDAFGILGSTRVEWILFDYALAMTGGVTVPIYPTSAAGDCAHALAHVDAVGVLAEDERQLAGIERLRPDLPTLEHVLSFADLDELAARGRDFAATHPHALEDATAAIDEDDLYTFMYTSGTTGRPKACMIRHRNAYELVDIVAEVDDLVEARDVILHWLPLAHNFGRLLHLLGTRVGYTTALCSDPSRLADALQIVKPTVLPGVPRIFEKVHDAAQSSLAGQTGPRRTLAQWALRVGRRASRLRQEGRTPPPSLALQHRLAGLLVYSRFRRRLGGRLRLAFSGAAPLAAEVAEFFDALDITILEGYGLSECTSAATVNRPGRYRLGTVGQPLPRYEVKLAEDGELLLRSGTVFAGYHGDLAATRSVLDDEGWLRTGDVAAIDTDGFIRITDRKKDIIVTSGGKNVAPQNLENALTSSPFISQALVVGDRRPYVSALVTLDPEAIGHWAAARGLTSDVAALAGHPEVRALVQIAVDRANRGRTRFEQIKRFAILPRELLLERGEVTPTLKVRRRVAVANFADEIDSLYAER